MYLLYCDDSGNSKNSDIKCSVIGGFAIHERQGYWIQKDIDAIMRHHIGNCDVELHANPIRTGKGYWRKINK